jgi:hypothetical protein
MQFDLTDALAQVVVSFVLLGGAWLVKLRRDINRTWSRIRKLEERLK